MTRASKRPAGIPVLVGVVCMLSGCGPREPGPRDRVLGAVIPEPSLPEWGDVQSASLEWRFDDPAELHTHGRWPRIGEWTLLGSSTGVRIRDGALEYRAEKSDCRLVLERELDLLRYSVLEVDLEVEDVAGTAAIFYRVAPGRFDSENRLPVRVTAGEEQTRRVNLGDVTKRPARIHGLRIDPTDRAGRVRVRAIRLLPARPRRVLASFLADGFTAGGERRPGRLFLGEGGLEWSVPESLDGALEMSAASLTPGDRVEIDVEIASAGGRKRRRARVVHADGWRGIRIALPPARSGERRLRVHARAAAPEGLFVLGPARVVGPAEEPPPNVLLVVVDTLRADRLSCYGYERATSPNLDRFAEGAVRFERALAPSPWTLPSVAALLTARYPREMGIRFGESHGLPASVRSVAEVLEEAGYDTRCLFANPVLRPGDGYARGFQRFVVPSNVALRADEVTDRALAWLDEVEDRAFFLYVHYMDPHAEYAPPAAEAESYPFLRPGDLEPPLPSVQQLFQGLREPSGPDELARLSRLYDAEIRYTDRHLGRLLRAVAARGLGENTLVVVTSDHGEEFREHGGVTHGMTLYDEVVRVPLLVRYPDGRGAGTVVQRPVGLIDVAPTVLAACGAGGAGAAAETAGRPLGEALDPSSPFGDRFLFSETFMLGPPRTSVSHGGWKYLVFDRDAPFEHPDDPLYRWLVGRTPARELFDRDTDPGERRDRLERDPEVAERLQRRVEAVRAIEAEPSPGRGLDAEMMERLRSLGYASPREDDNADAAAHDSAPSGDRGP